LPSLFLLFEHLTQNTEQTKLPSLFLFFEHRTQNTEQAELPSLFLLPEKTIGEQTNKRKGVLPYDEPAVSGSSDEQGGQQIYACCCHSEMHPHTDGTIAGGRRLPGRAKTGESGSLEDRQQ
jgi:hypothetical protein